MARSLPIAATSDDRLGAVVGLGALTGDANTGFYGFYGFRYAG